MKILRNTKTLTSLMFALVLVTAPVLGFADDNNNTSDKNNGKSISCVTAWGQLIRNGWKGKSLEMPATTTNCHIPFGIFKKWNWQGTIMRNNKQPDVVAPVITSFVVAPQVTTADASWTTNERTQGVVFYGTTTPVVSVNQATSTGLLSNSVYSSNSLSVTVDAGNALIGRKTLRMLTPDTTYYVILAVRDMAGNVTLSNVVSFTTTHALDTSVPRITNIMTTVKNSDFMTISWLTDELATTKVFYGTSSLNITATGTAQVGTTTLSTFHAVDVPRLSTTTPEYFIIQSTDAAGNTRTSAEYSVFLPL